MSPDRRAILALGLTLGTATVAAAADRRADAKALRGAFRDNAGSAVNGIIPNAAFDQTAALQALIDEAARKAIPVVLPAGTIRVGNLRLSARTALLGQSGRTILEFLGGSAFITADGADDLVLEGLVFDGAWKTWNEDRGEALLNIARGKGLAIEAVEIRNSVRSGLSLVECSGRVSDSRVVDVLDTGIKSLDAAGLDIRGNHVTRCGNNGVLVWRSAAGDDGTIVSSNRIAEIRNAGGGSGEYGNGVNIFRAGGVLVEGNRIHDCAYSAVRGNAASNLQIVANNCARLGEVALYAEFGFEGCVIASNVVDTAATGISVTNFNEGGRLAVIQGNLIRNLFRRETEAEDKQGEGIAVEADAVVSGNTIEGASSVGIQIGWGKYLRDVAATGNTVRACRVGISVSDDLEAGSCLIANNLISGAKDGAIRKMAHGRMLGPDLARDPKTAGRVTLAGNLAV